MSSSMQLSVGVLALTMIYATTPVFEGEKAATNEVIASNVSISSPAPIVGSNAISAPFQVDKIAAYRDPKAVAKNAKAALANSIATATEAFAVADMSVSAYQATVVRASAAADAAIAARAASAANSKNALLTAALGAAKQALSSADTAVEAALAASNIAINRAAVADSAVIKAEAIAAKAEQALKLASRKVKSTDQIVAGK